jgi:HAE1 family hydrophobic/amphiphilic exporter-1
LLAVLSLLVLGTLSITRIKIAFLPDVDFPFIGVFVPYPNAIPTQVEREIAKPIEEVLATLGDIKDIFSESNAQGCFVGVEFDFGRDVNVMRMDVQERLDQVRADLPADIQDLFLFTFNSNDIPIMVGRISAKGRDLAGSYDLLERRIIKPLERLDASPRAGGQHHPEISFSRWMRSRRTRWMSAASSRSSTATTSISRWGA